MSFSKALDTYSKIVSEYNQEIPQSQTADNPVRSHISAYNFHSRFILREDVKLANLCKRSHNPVAPRGRATQPSRLKIAHWP